MKLAERYGRRAGWMAAGLALVLCLGHQAGLVYARRHKGTSCPFGGARAQPSEAPMAWASAVASAGSGKVQKPVFLALNLQEANRPAVDRWAAQHGCQCRNKTSPVECICARPADFGPSFAGAQSSTAFFHLDGNDRLEEMTLLTKFADLLAARDSLLAGQLAWEDQFGPISGQSGSADSTFVTGALLQQMRFEFARENLFASLSATNFGGHVNVQQTIRCFL